jgi:hypothetical protein
MPSVIEAAARTAAQWGWRVFPCNFQKAPCQSGDWREYAATWPSETQGLNWHGADLYGICLPIGVVVLDLDTDPDGRLTMAADVLMGTPTAHHVANALMGLPSTYTVRTRSGGLHLYYRTHETLSQTGLGPKVDVRVGGLGYVIGAGSPGYEEITFSDGTVPDLLPLPVGLLRPARPKRLRDRRDPSA